MTILAGDIKLVAAQNMDDVPEGGGAPTSTEISDGASNAIFQDISEMDRAGGRVSLAKVFVSVQTNSREPYLGSNIIVAEMPEDPRVSVTIFKTAEGTFDRRTDARDRVEAFLGSGPIFDGFLFENHIAGQRTIRLFQREKSKVPTIGKTLYIVYDEGLAGEVGQYVRITDVTSEVRTFTDNSGGGAPVDYQARIVTCELSDTLRHSFLGSPPSRYFTAGSGKSLIRDTEVTDAAQYYSASRTTQEINIGDISATVESVFTQLVPSAQTEIPLIDMDAAGTADVVVACQAPNGTISYTHSGVFSASNSVFLGTAVLPGSLSITYPGGVVTDAGGELLLGGAVIGTINYPRGVATFASTAPSLAGSKTVTFTPAAAPVTVADTAGIAVTPESRAYNYSINIQPVPPPGTITASYCVNGEWYDLRDNGAGVLRGADASAGVGTCSYTTGTATITTGALPDVGSEIMWSWGPKANYNNTSSLAPDPLKLTFQLASTGIAAGSFGIEWDDGVATRTVTDNGRGVLIGAAGVGFINYATGLVELYPDYLPKADQSYQFSYSVAAQLTDVATGPLRNGDGSITLSLGNTGIAPGSVRIVCELDVNLTEQVSTTPAELQLYTAPTSMYAATPAQSEAPSPTPSNRSAFMAVYA